MLPVVKLAHKGLLPSRIYSYLAIAAHAGHTQCIPDQTPFGRPIGILTVLDNKIKKMNYLKPKSILILSVLFMIVSCSKDDPVNPMGIECNDADLIAPSQIFNGTAATTADVEQSTPNGVLPLGYQQNIQVPFQDSFLLKDECDITSLSVSGTLPDKNGGTKPYTLTIDDLTLTDDGLEFVNEYPSLTDLKLSFNTSRTMSVVLISGDDGPTFANEAGEVTLKNTAVPLENRNLWNAAFMPGVNRSYVSVAGYEGGVVPPSLEDGGLQTTNTAEIRSQMQTHFSEMGADATWALGKYDEATSNPDSDIAKKFTKDGVLYTRQLAALLMFDGIEGFEHTPRELLADNNVTVFMEDLPAQAAVHRVIGGDEHQYIFDSVSSPYRTLEEEATLWAHEFTHNDLTSDADIPEEAAADMMADLVFFTMLEKRPHLADRASTGTRTFAHVSRLHRYLNCGKAHPAAAFGVLTADLEGTDNISPGNTQPDSHPANQNSGNMEEFLKWFKSATETTSTETDVNSYVQKVLDALGAGNATVFNDNAFEQLDIAFSNGPFSSFEARAQLIDNFGMVRFNP